MSHPLFNSILSDRVNQLSLEQTEINELVKYYNDITVFALDMCAPIKTHTIKKHNNYPCYSSSFYQMKKERRRLERRWRKARNEHKLAALSVYKAQCRRLKIVQKQEFDLYCQNKFLLNRNNPQITTNFIKELSGKTPSSPLPDEDNKLLLANKYNDYFIEKIQTIRNSITPYFNALECKHKYTDSSLREFKTLSDPDVILLIARSKNKQCCLDPLPTELMKLHLDAYLPLVKEVLNRSLITGKFPDNLKHACIRPVLKNNKLDKNKLNSYRPVSNLPLLSIVIETAILDQLNSHMTKDNLLDPNQSAYRQGHSTETLLMHVSDIALRNLDNGKCTALLMLDLSAAFDTLDHPILLHTLYHHFGVCSTALKWFQSFLSNRTQCVKIAESMSETRTLSYGAPQGSVLAGPLFTIFMTPLQHVINMHSNVTYQSYADDTQLIISTTTRDQPDLDPLTKCIVDIRRFMNSYFLKLNEEKN